MFKNYVKVTLRSLVKYKGYTLINVGGLAVGLACCLLIVLYVQYELSFDRFHEKADRIYLVGTDVQSRVRAAKWGSTFFPVGSALKAAYPEVEEMVQLRNSGTYLVQHEERRYYEENLFFTQPSFFEIFDFVLLSGKAEDLARPYTMFLSETMARKYFGADDPRGREVLIRSQYSSDPPVPYEVVGVVEDAPSNAHFRYNFLVSLASQHAEGLAADDWKALAFTYLLLREAPSGAALEAKLSAFEQQHFEQQHTSSTSLNLTPLTDIHLYGGFDQVIALQGDIRYVYLFSAIALLILLIACINYMNLATARSARRAREVGIRKVVGARRAQLVAQFLGESILFTSLALVFALALAQLMLPLFNAMLDQALRLDLSHVDVVALLGGSVLVVGLLSGAYPAFFLSSFRPSRVLNGSLYTRAWPALRKGLVVFQFGVSIALIVCTIVIQRQLYFVQHTRLGFDDEQMVVLHTRRSLRDQAPALKEELSKQVGVARVALSSSVPSEPNMISFFDEDDIEDYEPTDETLIFDHLVIDHDFIETLGLELAAGRAFSESFPSDQEEALLINETAWQKLGWEEPLGKTFTFRSGKKRVVGIVRDFHIKTLKESIEPMLLTLNPTPGDPDTYVTVKLHPGNMASALSMLRAQWERFVPDAPFDYSFLDQDFEAMYRMEEKLGSLFLAFAALTVLVACLGLFGLASFTAEQRTKEIGIRKVLGATLGGIVLLLSKDFARLVVVGFAVAAPLAYLGAEWWLDNFAYRVELGAGTFVLAGLGAFVLALATVSYQSIRAALADPVESLRYE